MESEQINAIAIEWQVSTFGWAIRLHPDPQKLADILRVPG